MRLLRTELSRYGHLTDETLEFPEHARLCVVHGANEAGKSTALAAICDALFGFGHRTDYDFLHGGPHLRIGFTLSSRDGTVASFVRRKGRRDTLRDPADRVLPEDTLSRFLGGVTREQFERGFGLDGARLRQGGQELHRLGGEAGESLLAGAGLLNLRPVLLRLDEAAKMLVGDGHGRRRLSEATSAWRMAVRATEERAVAPRKWQEANEAHEAALSELSDVQARIRTLDTESSRLQRIRRVAPLLAQLADARERLMQLGDTPLLPHDAKARVDELTVARRDAVHDRDRETEAARRLTVEQAALQQDPTVLALQDAIDALLSHVVHVRHASDDLPKVRTEAAGLRARVAEAVEELGLCVEPEAARDMLPSERGRRAVRDLADQHADLSARKNAAARNLADAERRHDQASQAFATCQEPPDPARMRRTIDEVRSEGRLDDEWDRARRTLAAADKKLADALAALPLWTGDATALAVCQLPLPAQAERAAAQSNDATTRLHAARDEAAVLTGQIAELEDQLLSLSRGEQVPTPEVVAAARAERDRIWRLLRRAHEGGAAAPTELPERPLPDLFETARDRADHLADRRADDAQRVNAFLTMTVELERSRARRVHAKEQLDAALAELTQADDAWRTLWQPAGISPLAPQAMLEWRQKREEVLRLGDVATAARYELEAITRRRDRAVAMLSELLPALEEAESFTASLVRADTVCRAAEKAMDAYRKHEQMLSEANERLPELRAGATEAAAALADWRQRWSPAVLELGLPSDADVVSARFALDAWQRIAESVPAWRTAERRVAEMANSIDAFANDVRALCARLGEAPSDEPPDVLAARLGRRLDEARKAANDAVKLAERIAEHKRRSADAERRLNSAEAELGQLREQARVADDEALALAIDRAKARDALAQQVAWLADQLRTQGDGAAEAALLVEVREVGPDEAVARLAEIDRERPSLEQRLQDLSAQRASLVATLDAMRRGHDAASLAQQAQDALADARDAAERYARLHVARTLLRAGIDRFRRQQQGPLLSAASAHFSLLTGGRYARLIVDYDDADRPVMLAVRDTGVECPVRALSDGARDQLYLALRVAAIEQHAAQSEPLPFVADDILVHFDDVRATAAIALLAELGRVTQVILFTHHDHVAALAGRQQGAVVLSLPATVPPPLTAAAA